MLGNPRRHRSLSSEGYEGRLLLRLIMGGFDVDVALTVYRNINLLH